MTEADPGSRPARVAQVAALLRRLKAEGDRLAAAVAAREHVNHTDLTALMHLMEAEAAHESLTPGVLQRALGLSSGATTAVIDRLEALGHARRDRDAGDRRRVNLHYDTAGREVGERYFRPLAMSLATALDGFSDEELAVVERFLTDVVQVYAAHSQAVDEGTLG